MIFGLIYFSSLQAEFSRLKASLEMGRKLVKEKSREIESKNKKINTLIEEITMMEARHDVMENEIDIENLLQCNLGELSMKDMMNMTDVSFPADLIDLDFPPLDIQSEQPQLHSSFMMEEGRTISNIDSVKAAEVVHVNRPEIDEQKVQKRVSHSQTVKEETKFHMVQKRESPGTYQTGSSSSKIWQISFPPSEELLTAQFISCPHCSMIFSRRCQWMLKNHISECHNTGMTYPCQYCDKQFTDQSILIAHSMRHHLTHP